MRPESRTLLVALWAAVAGAGVASACAEERLSEREQVKVEVQTDVPGRCDEELALRLYRRRIEPLFDDDRPSSCSQCHLSGLDLGLYVQDSPCETMACLVQDKLVDPKQPTESLLLSWIGRAEPESDLITERVIAEEYEGMRQWIEYNLRCDACEDVVCPNPSTGKDALFCEGAPEVSLEFDPKTVDEGGCGPAELETLFRDTVFAGRGRCAPCHFNDRDASAHDNAPKWIDVQDDCTSAVSRTLRNLERRELLDVQEPKKSLLLVKPLPEDLGGVMHGGHDKFYDTSHDTGYLAFLYFAERYAECKAEEALTSEEEPSE